MLIFWTSADADLIKKTIGVALKAMSPNIPQHEFIELDDDDPSPPSAMKGDVVVICGAKALNHCQKLGIFPKNRTVDSMREKPQCPAGQGHYMVTYDPATTRSEPEKAALIQWDVQLSARLMQTGSLEPIVGEYVWVQNFTKLIKFIENQYIATGKPVDVAADLETDTFHPWYPDRDIVSISFTPVAGYSHVMYVGKQKHPVDLDLPKGDIRFANIFDQINWLLTTPKIKLRGSNWKFDAIWIAEKWDIECTNFKFDNMLVGSILDENRSNGLNTHAKIMTEIGGYDDSFNAKYDKSKMAYHPPNKDFLTYAGGDTDAAFRVADVLRNELVEDDQLTKFYITILHPAARAFEKLERRGLLVDQDKFQVLKKDLERQIDKDQAQALSLLPNKIRYKYMDKIEKALADGKDPLPGAVLQEYFFGANGLHLKPLMFTPKLDKDGNKKISTAKAHLKMFYDHPEAKAMGEVLESLGSATKTLSTFVVGFLKHLRPDGKFHPTYFLAHGDFEGHDDDDSGTVTGRLSAKEPAVQTIPKKTKWTKRIRECFIAPPGKVILMLDFSQGELRIIACLAKEKNMLKAYQSGQDLHIVTGARLAKLSYEELAGGKDSTAPWLNPPFDAVSYTLDGRLSYFRDRAKPANFGLLYDVQAEGFARYAWAQFSLKLSIPEAEQIRTDFFELYPNILDYHEEMRSKVKKLKYIRSPLGRIRHLPMIDAWDKQVKSRANRQAINFPVQATLTDMMIWAIAKIEQQYGDDIACIGQVHDQVITLVDEDKVELRAKQAQEIMQNLPFHQFGWKPQLQFLADAEWGHNMAHTTKLKLAA